MRLLGPLALSAKYLPFPRFYKLGETDGWTHPFLDVVASKYGFARAKTELHGIARAKTHSRVRKPNRACENLIARAKTESHVQKRNRACENGIARGKMESRMRKRKRKKTFSCLIPVR